MPLVLAGGAAAGATIANVTGGALLVCFAIPDCREGALDTIEAGLGILSKGIDDIKDIALRLRCQRLRKLKEAACTSGFSCGSRDCCKTISRKIRQGKKCLELRLKITAVCFGGEDNSGRDHSGQEAGVQNAINNCIRLHRRKNC